MWVGGRGCCFPVAVVTNGHDTKASGIKHHHTLEDWGLKWVLLDDYQGTGKPMFFLEPVLENLFPYLS